MILLLIVSSVWALSFGLIKGKLAGVPPDVVNAVRLGLTLLVFAPFLPGSGLPRRRALALMAVGGVQFGAMYALYTRSYAALGAHEVALATILTSVYVTLLEDALARRLRPRFLGAAALAAVGTGLCLGVGAWKGPPLGGVLLVQAANLCFAVGQVAYRRVMAGQAVEDRRAFAWCALGAALVGFVFAAPVLATRGWPALTTTQGAVLVYLGVLASGVCFFLWNKGARQVNSGVLAVMNDLKIPLGVLLSITVFGEQVAGWRVAGGGALIGLAWLLAARGERAPAAG